MRTPRLRPFLRRRPFLRQRSFLVTGTAGLALCAAACSAPAEASKPGVGANPLTTTRLAVVPGKAAAAAGELAAAGRSADARLVSRLADQPTATWLTRGSASEVEGTVHRIVTAAAGESPVLVLYDVPGRDCGSFSSGGAPNAAAYASWIAGVARGLGSAPAVIILEPDAVAQTLPEAGCQPFDDAGADSARYALLAGAVRTLGRDTRAHVYLDAGNAGWIQDLAGLAAALRESGIEHAAGFSLNVSSFYTTAGSIRYGTALAGYLGGAHFVIDTSRNGAGYYAPPAGDDQPAWCNPPGRRLGEQPTTRTGHPGVDAYLWIKVPGESDGSCRGGPTSGQWWPDYALSLAGRGGS